MNRRGSRGCRSGASSLVRSCQYRPIWEGFRAAAWASLLTMLEICMMHFSHQSGWTVM